MTRHRLLSTCSLGAEYARQLASRGYGIVVVSNRREENLQMATSLSSRYGVEALPLYADLTRAEAAREIYDYVHQMGIEVEILGSRSAAFASSAR